MFVVRIGESPQQSHVVKKNLAETDDLDHT